MGIIAGIVALLALLDLFDDPGNHVLPWWGDVIVLAGAGIYYLASCWLLGDDD